MSALLPRTTLGRLVAVPALVLALGTPALVQATAADRPAKSHGTSRHTTEDASSALTWQGIAMATIYPANPVPSGVPLLGFTSGAVYDAVRASVHTHHSSEAAAVATAAHDVLAHYLPAAESALDTQLATSLAAVPDGRSQARGERIGAWAADRMIESRKHDGYGDTTIHYTLAPAPGIWQPVPPATDMTVPWLGSLRPLVLHDLVELDGPDPLSSVSYARDYDEVRLYGAATGSLRSTAQTATAQFFNSNAATMVTDALVRHLTAKPLGLVETARLFAGMHGAMTDSVIAAWEAKRDVGFWRPYEAIAGAAADGNPMTQPQSGWAPLIPNPAYSDYVSGHASVTSPAIEMIRLTLGEDTSLELRSVNGPPRTYPNLGTIEYEAFHARIWGGLHFADAMDDGYELGHETARQVHDKLW